MVITFLAVLNASSLCVARTDICAPAGSTIDGALTQNGGQVTITPSKPMKALGAEFRAGGKLVVDVLPWWSSNKTAGAIVHVTGELSGESVISGARVAGTVRLGQLQGKPGSPQLVQATDLKGGKLTISTAGTVDITPGMQLQGNVDIGSVRLDVTSAQPIHAIGLDLDAGVVRIEVRPTSYTISGTLSHPQDLAGVRVDKQVWATIENGHPKFQMATLASVTPLQALGLPDGEVAAGTLVRTEPAGTLVFGPATVCGIPLAPTPTQTQPAVTFTPAGQPAQFGVSAALARADVDVGRGIHMSGLVTLHYEAGGCHLLGVDGTLARDTEQQKLHFAARTPLFLGEIAGEQIVRGTLAGPELVDGLTLTGTLMVGVTKTGEVHLLDATLAKGARFEDWDLPAGAHIGRFTGGWSFTTSRGTSARAVATHHGERVDKVVEARSDASSTTFMLARPHTPAGTTLAFNSLAIDHATGCMLGDVTTAQTFGIFQVPAGGNATLCKAKVTAAQGTYAVPSLQVGRWFATHAFAGALGSKPPSTDSPVSRAPAPASSGVPTGYWLQINSLCQGASGIPQPPPKERWIWVDLKGQAVSTSDQNMLATSAAKAGSPCPVTPCCPP